ncbi:MAG: DNA polymerase III subunit beta [Paludibacteraceae bacterium]|nr:DNA polymerase III subunit beta [Paludibacteraceae bacterium]
MKFSVSSTKLLVQLQTISRVLASKNTLAILSDFYFELNDNQLTIKASDSETTMFTSIEVFDVEGQGKFCVGARLLTDTLKEFAEQPLLFTIDDENLSVIINSEYGEYKFIGENANEYPILNPLEEDSHTFEIMSEALLHGINKTFFCTADDDIRPVMNGIDFDLKEDSITFVATDAHKLVRLVNTSVKSEVPCSFILPKKPANLLRNILPKEDEQVQVTFDSKNIIFKSTNYTLICRRVEGRYPNYNAVIPQNNSHIIFADRLSLLNALKRVHVFSNQGSNLIKLEIRENMIIASSKDINFSTSAEERIPCQYDGEPLIIGFKSLFLIDILANIESNDVKLEIEDPSRAGLILPAENNDSEDLLMLLMPMLINE